ncbi:hypothetical protein [Flavobacterium aquidurense]|uniref:hypothetical protein n=1 Tax=Flavobacterium aquidurense TaxID=362413 RepID=UPI0037145ABD
METYTDHTYQEAELYFQQKYQRGHLDVDTAILIDKAIDNLLRRDNITRNENIPNQEKVVDEDDYIANNPDEEFEIIDADDPDEEEHIEDEDHFDDDDLERNDN